MSLRWRFALLFAGGAALATVLVASAAFVTTRRALDSETDSFLWERARTLSAAFPFAENLNVVDAEDPIRIGARGREREGVQTGELAEILFGTDAVFQWADLKTNKPLATMRDAPPLPILYPDKDAAENSLPVRFDSVAVSERPYRMLTILVTADSVMSIARDVTGQQGVLAVLRTRIFFIGALVAAAAGGGGWLAARRVTRPMEILTRAAEEVAETRELLEPIETGASGEAGRLAKSFNSMIAALRDSRDRQKRLVQDASHELRTPLTSLRTNVEMLGRADELPPEERERLLADVHHELKELSVLVTELVDLASEQSGREAEEEARPTALRAVAVLVAERASRRWQRPVRVAGEGGALVARPGALQRAVENLVDNALKWGPPPGPVDITLSGGELLVRDYGPGIPDEDLPYIFDRFYRTAEARSRPGSGLGLAIVKGVVESHGGRVCARNHPGGGAEVGFTLPVQPPATDQRRT